MKKRIIVGLFFAILFISFISASFEVKNYSIQKSYASGEKLVGWVNISFTDESADSSLKDSLGNSINLYNFLKENKNYSFSCEPQDCSSNYNPIADSGALTKLFTLNNGESKAIGIKLIGKITGINTFNLEITSNAPNSCTPQLEIDFLNDGYKEYNPREYQTQLVYSPTLCIDSKSSGCYGPEHSEKMEVKRITDTPFCQRISLLESAGVQLRANVDWNNYVGDINMEIYDIASGGASNCQLTATGIDSEGYHYCDIDNNAYFPRGEYYVCIYSDGGDYPLLPKTRGYENTTRGCGFYGEPNSGFSEGYIYDISLIGKQFGALGKIYDSTTPPMNSQDVYNYLQTKYQTSVTNDGQEYIDCSTQNCIIPIKFYSKINNQGITAGNLEVVVNTIGGPADETNFIDMSETPALITSLFQKIDLSKTNFSIFGDYGVLTYKLKLEDKELISEDLTIEKISSINSITPIVTASGFPTTFEVDLNAVRNLTNYEWNFGDNITINGSSNKMVHKYNLPGNYTLIFTITDSIGKKVSKKFEITVVSPKSLIESALQKMQDNLLNVNNQLSEFPEFYKTSIDPILGLTDLDIKLKQLQASFISAGTETAYNQIISDLFELKIPESVFESDSLESITFYPSQENIDLDALKSISGGNYDDKEKYVNAVYAWNQEKLETKISYKEISVNYDALPEPILKIFEIKLNDKGGLNENPYLIMSALENIHFKQDYGQKEEGGKIYLHLSPGITSIEFSTTEDIDFLGPPLFISPSLDTLPVETIVIEEETSMSKWIYFGLVIFLLFLIGIGVYIALQTWYKRKYENYLFKNRNDLYNMIHYVHNSQKQELDNDTITSNLKKSGWNSEQVDYVMKKYSGKRTGMIEIPINKILKNK
jgi:hypothetical protein